MNARPDSASAPSPAPIPAHWLALLHQGIAHRGPDGRGTFIDYATRTTPQGELQHVQVALTHARLSIIDHAGGAQPMVMNASNHRDPSESTHTPAQRQAASSNLALVFNGCIYNHRQFRRQLEAAGARFTTDHSDTETILHAFQAHANGATRHLDGMYALALWDGPRATLWLARDFAHEKPLFASQHHQTTTTHHVRTLWFASTAAAVVTLKATLNTEFGTDDPLRVAPIEHLAPWIWLGAGTSAPGPAQHWHPRGTLESIEDLSPDSTDARAPTTDRPTHQLRRARRETHALPNPADLTPDRVDELLASSVRDRLDADVPLGCFLSGGLDSGLVASHAQRALRDMGAGPLKTFTVRMPAGAHDESPVAQAIARHLGTKHHTLECQSTAATDLVTLIEQLGEPLGDSSLLPTYWISRAVRPHAKVALTGDGGDELFGGYDRHTAALVIGPRGHVRGALLRSLISALDPALLTDLRALLPATRRAGNLARLLDRAQRLAAGVALGYDELRAQAPMAMLRQLVPSVAQFTCDWNLGPIERDRAAADPLAHDFFSYLGPDVLCKTDTASMARGVGLELRAPMLARPLVEAALATPLHALMPNRPSIIGRIPQRKGLLRTVAARHLPHAVLNLSKRGFAVPIGRWFREDFGALGTLLQDRLLGPEPFGPNHLGLAPIISRGAVVQMLEEHLGQRSGSGQRAGPTCDHGHRLFGLLTLSIWAQWLGRVQGLAWVERPAQARPAGSQPDGGIAPRDSAHD